MLFCDVVEPADMLESFLAAEPSDRLVLLLLEAVVVAEVTAGELFLSGAPFGFFLKEPKHAMSWYSEKL